MSAGDKIERLVNLIALLLETRRPLPVAEIRQKIPGYHGDSDEAFHRKFERDKAELRELGFLLEQEDSIWGDAGYRMSKREALLQDPGLAQDEMAALALAARAWGGGGDGELGLLKLSVGTTGSDAAPAGWLLPRVEVDRTIASLFDAIARRKVVRFRYRGSGGTAEEREVEPHRLVHRGDWYLTAFDRAREALRHFKLSRVDGQIRVGGGRDADFDPPAAGDDDEPRAPWEGEPVVHARVAFAPEAAWWAERRAASERVTERDDGWVELSMPVADIESFAGWLAGFADEAVAVEPADLREAVVARMQAVLRGEG